MVWKTSPSRSVVTCRACSWWAPVIEEDANWVVKEFDAHVCADHPPLGDTEEPQLQDSKTSCQPTHSAPFLPMSAQDLLLGPAHGETRTSDFRVQW
jgi:hypothetical protein